MRPRRPSLPTVISLLALFFALGGTAIAARHYLITSTKQIAPSVLSKLKGDAGQPGPTGARGEIGPRGEAGPRGESGPKGETGLKGELGQKGETGPQGAPGADGTTVVARIRSAGAVMTQSTDPKHATYTNDPLTGATWTQGAQELDQIMGEVEITMPTEATCGTGTGGPPNGGTGVVLIYFNGSLVGEARAYAVSTATTRLRQLKWGEQFVGGGGFSYLLEPASFLTAYEPGTPTGETLTAKIADDCGYENAQTGGHFTIDSIKIDVLGAK